MITDCRQCDNRCSNRDKCRKKCRNIIVNEIPERDMPRTDYQQTNFNYLPLSEPPEGDDWELQYCKWSGWTWVRKQDKESKVYKPNSLYQQEEEEDCCQIARRRRFERRHKQKKRKSGRGGLCSCFKKQKAHKSPSQLIALRHDSDMPTPRETYFQNQEQSLSRPTRNAWSENIEPSYRYATDLEPFCCCCCCCCNQMCCQSNGSDESDHKNTCGMQTADCKCMETQTCYEVKNQATKMSDVSVLRRSDPQKRRMFKYRTVCCPCRRKCCCCCCCRCAQNNGQKTDEKNKSDESLKNNIETDNIINYCLMDNLPKIKKSDYLNLKSSSFSTLHKSLEILLKNNINIMKFFDSVKNKDLNETKPITHLNSNETIFSLSADNILKTRNQEHSSWLTAVCDAILSSRKYDNEKCISSVPSKIPSIKSSQRTCEAKDSENSFTLPNGGGLLEKILNENFPVLNKSGDNNYVNQRRSDQAFLKKTKRKPESCDSKKSLTNLLLKKSKMFTVRQLPSRAENVKRYIDFVNSGGIERKCRKMLKKNDKTLRIDADNQLPVTEFACDEPVASSSRQNASSRLDTINNLWKRFNLNNTNQDPNVQFLDDISPPYNDLDLLMTFDDNNQSDKSRDT